jgi:hypothetical protein
MMTENRLSALFLINVYHTIDIIDLLNYITDIFTNFKNRLFEFLL